MFMKAWIKKLKDSTEGPHSRSSVPTHTARLAASTKKCAMSGKEILDFRDELTTDDSVLLKGLRLVIPHKLQEEYLHHLHEGHLSASKVQDNTKEHMYWPGINADIEDYTQRCKECIKQSQIVSAAS